MDLVRLEVQTTAREQLVDVTEKVRQVVRGSGVTSGLCLVSSPHTTAGVTVNENADPDVRHDLLLALRNAVPEQAAAGGYRHGEGNSDAHVKTSLVGTSQLIPVEGGTLVLGTWQGVFLCEFDGPRRRTVQVKVVAG
ncbi:MAG TPA: secondary thiamine-phosphate synthase enzyme YjbQ [Anaeromyxobacteraceae bacterium]|jgi:secondary thiamine-phosphate synthase enzyme|nr:secondary thiamine-phosphate synthase enzyme YjbQ [Anaeromyxobacteraceae bacterium]